MLGLIFFTFTVQDVVITDLTLLTKTVQSLENKYVEYIYSKLEAVGNCEPCTASTGNKKCHFYMS